MHMRQAHANCWAFLLIYVTSAFTSSGPIFGSNYMYIASTSVICSMYTMKKIYFQYIYWKRICLYNEACLADAERWQKRCNVYGTIKFR